MTRPQSSLWPAARDAVALTSSWLPTSLCTPVRAGRGQPGPVPAREVGVPSAPDADSARHPPCLQLPVSHGGREGDCPGSGSRPKVLPVSGTRGSERSADSCQAVCDSRASALPGLRHRVPVIRFFLTSRNCRAGSLEYHMASSTCCRLVSISLAGPTWLPLRTSPSCPSASSPAVSRLLQTLARPSSPQLTSLFLLRSQRRVPDCISRQAPRLVANGRPRIWRRRRRTGRGGFVRGGGGGGGGGGGDGGGSWQRGDPDGGRSWVPGAWERCAAFNQSPGTSLPFGAASLWLLSGTSSYAATLVRPPPLRSAPPAAFRLPANEPGRPGRGPSQCRPPWQGCSARGKSSPRIS